MSDREQGAFADWAASLDDLLTQRLTHCTVCQRTDLCRWGICGERTGLVVSYAVCKAHDSADGIREAEGVLARRYLTTLGQAS